MIDLDKYINNSLSVKMFGEEYDILEPTIAMNMQMKEIEKDRTDENLHEKRLEAGILLLNHNKQGKKFTENELAQLPFEALTRVIAEIALLRLKAEQDPNSGSRSPMEK